MLSPAEQVNNALNSAQIHYTNYPGGQLFWQQWTTPSSTTAAPLVLLHGGFGSWNHWFPNVQMLREQREVWTVDLPGLGQSGDMPEPFSISHFAEIVFSGLNQLLGSDTAFALGSFSFGSMIAGELAVLASQRCSRCTLIGAAGFGDLHVQVPLLAPPTPTTDPREADRIQRENLQRLMLSKQSTIDDLAVHLHSENLANHRFRSRALAKTNLLADLLPLIPAKLVGLWGLNDATAGGADNIEARRDLFARAQKEAEFHVVSDAGHWVMYEAPAKVNSVLLADI